MQTTTMKKRYSNTFLNTNKPNTLTFSSISKKKSTAVHGSNQSLIEGFTPHQQAEFDKGITIENYTKSRGILL
jgi:hypothetical protein